LYDIVSELVWFFYLSATFKAMWWFWR